MLGNAKILEINPGIALVAALEVAVMRARDQRGVVGQRRGFAAGIVQIRRPVNCRRTGVDEPLDLRPGQPHRLEHGQTCRRR